MRRAVRVAALAAVAVALVPVARARALEELELPPITRVQLENGLRIVVAEHRELPLVEISVIVGAGAAQDPPGKDGVAALTAGTLHRGAAGRSAEELARAIESLGGRIDVGAGTDGTVASAEFLSKDVEAGTELLRQILLEPEFARDEVRRAREEQLAGIVADLESPSRVAEKCFAAFLFGDHPYGRPPEGRTETVEDLGGRDVRAFYDRWYRPNNTVLVLVGDVDTTAAVALLRKAFGGWEPRPDAVPVRIPPPKPLAERRVLVVDKPDATQTQIRFGNIAIPRNHPDYIPAQVANTILGGGFTSRLIEELRVKRSLTYSAWSQFVARLVGGDFRVGTFTKSPTTAETLGLALEVMGRFRAAPPAPAALAKARTYLVGQYPLRLEAPDALAGRLAEIEFHGLPEDELRTYRSRVTAVGARDVAAVAARHMPAPDHVAIVVVGRAAEIEAELGTAFGPVRTIAARECDALSARR